MKMQEVTVAKLELIVILSKSLSLVNTIIYLAELCESSANSGGNRMLAIAVEISMDFKRKVTDKN